MARVSLMLLAVAAAEIARAEYGTVSGVDRLDVVPPRSLRAKSDSLEPDMQDVFHPLRQVPIVEEQGKKQQQQQHESDSKQSLQREQPVNELNDGLRDYIFDNSSPESGNINKIKKKEIDMSQSDIREKIHPKREASIPKPETPSSEAKRTNQDTPNPDHALPAFDIWNVEKRKLHPSHSHNQIELFNYRQILVQRIVATSSSCALIALCLLGMYMFLAIDPRRLVFRHQLIFFLLFFDLLKAVILLLYPTRVLVHSTAYFNDNFCQIVGFFTATAIEGADIAILAFAVHTCLLIFYPQLTTRVRNSAHTEGGLYRYRNYVYFASFLIPLVLASLAFIGRKGYTSLVCWCYLPQKPVWYRLVLSWVPRWCIVVTIIVIYCWIYFHVIREFKTLGGVFTTMHHQQDTQLLNKPSFFSALKFFFNRVIPKWTLPEENYSRRGSSVTVTNLRVSKKQDEDPNDLESFRGETQRPDNDSDNADPHEPAEYDPHNTNGMNEQHPGNIYGHDDVHQVNLEKFKKRQRIIEKQMKLIFIYPFAYCFVWLFPFILYVTQINYEEEHGPIYWINCVGAFMQPLNGFVDTLVFFYREQPWEHTIKKTFERDHAQRLEGIVNRSNRRDSASATSTRINSTTRNSITALTAEFEGYPKWRQWLSWFRLPFFVLPDEANTMEFQSSYLNKMEKEPQDPGAGARHEFLSILADGDDDFRMVLEGYLVDKGRKGSTMSLKVDSRVESRMNSIDEGPKKKPVMASVGEDNSDSEMDFLEFLRK